jgi:hypothetical protein
MSFTVEGWLLEFRSLSVIGLAAGVLSASGRGLATGDLV